MTDTPPTPNDRPASEPEAGSELTASGPAADDQQGAPGSPVTLEPVSAEVASTGRSGRLIGYLAAALVGIALTVGVLLASGSLELGFAASATAEPTGNPTTSGDPAATGDPGPSGPGIAVGRVQGDPDAPVTIEIWADFQCPFCSLSAEGVEPEVVRQYATSGEASVVFRDFGFLGEESFDAAVAARCAGNQGLFWHYHDLLFASQQGENQGAFARERLLNLASYAGLEPSAFEACLDDPAVRDEVEAETAEGRSLGVVSTPTWRIVGPGGPVFVTGLKPLADIQAAFDKASDPNYTPEPSPEPSPSPSG